MNVQKPELKKGQVWRLTTLINGTEQHTDFLIESAGKQFVTFHNLATPWRVGCLRHTRQWADGYFKDATFLYNTRGNR